MRARFKHYQDKVAKAIISPQEANLERNQILDGIITETRDLEENERSIYVGENVNKKIVTYTLTEDKILELTKTAVIIIEIEKLNDGFNELDWDNKYRRLEKLFMFKNHNTIHLAREIFSFLSSVADWTRFGMTSSVAYTIESLVIEYFPYFEEDENEEFQNISFRCIYLAHDIFYDAVIHLRNLEVGIEGLRILKWVYWKAKERNDAIVMAKVKEKYKALESTLKRPERNDLGKAQELLQIFKNDLDENGLANPLMPDRLFKEVFKSMF